MSSTRWRLWTLTTRAIAERIARPKRPEKTNLGGGGRAGVLLSLLVIFWTGPRPAVAGDAFYGRVTDVESGEVVTVADRDRRYKIRLIGIEVPVDNEPIASQARRFLESVRDKNPAVT